MIKNGAIAKLSVYAAAIGIALQIIFLNPFYGLMDDANILSSVLPQLQNHGLSFFFDFLKSDLSWGMFRVTYPPFILLFYSTANLGGPLAFYLFNLVLVFGLFYLSASVFSKILKLDKWLLLLFVFFLVPFYDLLQHPSLQEKIVQFFGIILIALSASKKRSLIRLTGIVFVTILGFFSKASFLIYASMSFLILLSNVDWKKDKKARWSLGLIAFTNLLSVIFLKYIGNQGSYTTKYSWSNVLPNLASFNGLFYVALILLGLFFIYQKKGSLSEKLVQFFPTAGILTFLIVFLPWGVRGYLQSIICIAVATLFTQFFTLYKGHTKKALIPLCFGALIFSSFTTYSTFNRLRDIRNVVNWGVALKAKKYDEIYMPCFEGRSSMQFYFKSYGKSSINVLLLEGQSAVGKTIFFDQKMCPLPFSAENCDLEVLYQSPLKSGYKLATFKSCKPL